MLSASLNKTFLSFLIFEIKPNYLKWIFLRLYASDIWSRHSDSKRGNMLPPHGLLFPISSKGSFICIIPQTYHSLCYTSRGALAGLIFEIKQNYLKWISTIEYVSDIHIWSLVLEKEGNVLFNAALNTFYVWLCCIGHMVEDHSDIEIGNPLHELYIN